MRDRLFRSRDDRVLFGVCGGIADWLDLDPSLVRIVFALLTITGGFGLLLYIVMAIVVPEEPDYVPMPMPAGAVPSAGASTAAASAADAEKASTGTSPSAGAGSAPAAAPDPAPYAGGYPPGGWISEREARRAARRAARREHRAHNDGRAGVIFGSILVLAGLWFLARRYLPALDGDFLGPLILIAIGAIVVVSAVGRKDGGGPAKPG